MHNKLKEINLMAGWLDHAIQLLCLAPLLKKTEKNNIKASIKFFWH